MRRPSAYRPLAVIALAGAALAAAAAQPRQVGDSTKAPASAPQPPRRASRTSPDTNPHAIPRDYVGAADTTCDDLCRRERRLDSLYGKDRERVPKPAVPAPKPTKP